MTLLQWLRPITHSKALVVRRLQPQVVAAVIGGSAAVDIWLVPSADVAQVAYQAASAAAAAASNAAGAASTAMSGAAAEAASALSNINSLQVESSKDFEFDQFADQFHSISCLIMFDLFILISSYVVPIFFKASCAGGHGIIVNDHVFDSAVDCRSRCRVGFVYDWLCWPRPGEAHA